MLRLAALLTNGFGLGLVCLLLSGTPARADAQDPCVADPVCRDHEDRGIEASTQKDYAEALVEFQAAYARTPTPRLLINIGRSLFRLGQPAEALKYYERFMRAETSPAPEVAQRIKRYIEEAKAAVAAAPTKPPVIEPPVKRDELPAVPPPSAHQEQAVSPSSSPPIQVNVPAIPHRVAPPFPVGAGVLLGLGTASLAVGIGLGSRALNLTREVITGSGPFDEDLYAQGIATNQAAIALDVIGGAALVAGGVWTILWIRQRKHPERSGQVSAFNGTVSIHEGS